MRILTFNCHEAWVYQLAVLGAELDIVIGLEGRYTQEWDLCMRPKPPRSRFLTLQELQQSRQNYDCIIVHNISDLLDCKAMNAPKLMILHGTMEGRMSNEQSDISGDKLKALLKKYLAVLAVHIVAVSKLKADSWGLNCDVIHNCVDIADYFPHQGSKAMGLRVCNHISSRPEILMWEFYQAAFGELDVRLIGHNPDIPNSHAARDWNDLKQAFSQHRYYIHTADPRLEDGFNLAMFEAMAAGLPVLGNCHPSSVIEHGKSGFLSDDPKELRQYALRLMAEPTLAKQMGKFARNTIEQGYSLQKFKKKMLRSIKKAQNKWRKAGRRAD